MKIVSWNINGIRSLKSDIRDILKTLDADIICFQETKISRSLLEETIAIIEGYSSYFSFPRYLNGYSGVATYCKDSCKPISAKEGLSDILQIENYEQSLYSDIFTSSELFNLDSEGRTIITEHLIRCSNIEKKLILINVYCPCADPDKPERKEYKLKFYKLLQYATRIFLKKDYHVVIVGDINTTRKLIDHCDPGNEEEFFKESSRKWLNSFLSEVDETTELKFQTNGIMVDTFRYFHPKQKDAYTCWNSKRSARLVNYGTRIDYILIDKFFLPYLRNSILLPDIQGSDHCPVAAEFDCLTQPSKRCPELSTRHWLEFAGKQQKLYSFLENTKENLKRKEETDIQSQGKLKKNEISVKQKSIIQFLSNTNKIKLDYKIDTKAKPSNFNSQIINEGVKSSLWNQNNLKDDTKIKLESSKKETTEKQKSLWKIILSGPPEPPLCKGHKEKCILRTVKKQGPNIGKQFFSCARPNGHSSDPNASCNHFQWVIPTNPLLEKS